MRSAAAASVLLLVFHAGPSRADKAIAKDHFKKGMAAYTLDNYDRAIAEFQAGFQEEPDPVFLYNIAQAYRLSNRPKPAIEFYHKYLKLSSEAKNRAEVEQQIAALEKTTGSPTEALNPDDKRAAAGYVPPPPPDDKNRPAGSTTATPTGTTAAGGTTGNATTNGSVSAASVPAGAMPPPNGGSTEKEAPRRKTWPIAVGVAAGVLVVGAGVAVAVVLASPAEPTLPLQSAR